MTASVGASVRASGGAGSFVVSDGMGGSVSITAGGGAKAEGCSGSDLMILAAATGTASAATRTVTGAGGLLATGAALSAGLDLYLSLRKFIDEPKLPNSNFSSVGASLSTGLVGALAVTVERGDGAVLLRTVAFESVPRNSVAEDDRFCLRVLVSAFAVPAFGPIKIAELH